MLGMLVKRWGIETIAVELKPSLVIDDSSDHAATVAAWLNPETEDQTASARCAARTPGSLSEN